MILLVNELRADGYRGVLHAQTGCATIRARARICKRVDCLDLLERDSKIIAKYIQCKLVESMCDV